MRQSFFLTALGCAISLFPAYASDARTPVMWAYGIGYQSCAYWLSNAYTENEGATWILGYWTGRNMANAPDRMVGSNSDADGLTGEIKKTCVQEPSTRLMDAIERTYIVFQKAGK